MQTFASPDWHSQGEGVVRAERFLLVLVIWYRVFHAVDQIVPVPVLLNRYRSGAIAFAVVCAWIVESTFLLRRAWDHGAYNQPWLIGFDAAFTLLVAVSAAWAGPPLPPTPTYSPGIVHATALGVGAATRNVGAALGISLLLSVALVAGLGLGARESAQPGSLPLDAGITPIALAVAAAILARHVLQGGRDLDVARAAATQREAELSAQQERTRTARELHDKVLQTLETVARGSDVDDEALRDQARTEAGRLRQLVRTMSAADAVLPTGPEPEPGNEAVARAERSLLLGYILFRVASLVFVLIGPLATKDVRSVPLAATLAAACVVEAALIVGIDRRRAFHGRDVALVDMGFTIVALIAGVWLVARPQAAAFTAIFGMGTMLGAGLAFRSGVAFVQAAAMTSAAYIAALYVRFDGSALFEPVARDAVWFFAWGGIAWLLARELRNSDAQIDAATWRAVRTARAASAEGERARTASWLAAEVLPTIESLSGTAAAQSAEVKSLATRASTWLQAYVQGRDSDFAGSGLINSLRDAVRLHSDRGLTVDLNVAGMWADDDVKPTTKHVLEALTGAVGEALENVRRHAGVTRAVVRAIPEAEGVVVTVVDEGSGFDHSKGAGFGISQSIVRRMEEVGGKANVESSPSGGTRVVIWVPGA